jgi:methyl-accepting chemotaxis protein
MTLVAIYSEELFTLPSYVQQLKQQFDSPSRLVFSGKGLTAIVDYSLKLSQARLRTVLGRSNDYGNNLVTTAVTLGESSSQTLSGLMVQNDHLDQLATAITEISRSASTLLIVPNKQHRYWLKTLQVRRTRRYR